jgi:TPR repeat protein
VKRDLKQALYWLQKAAVQDNAMAQYNLGVLYTENRGIPVDYTAGADWFMKAALQGNSDAQNNLGSLYANGQGVPKSYVHAFYWLDIAAQNGDRVAQEKRDRVMDQMTDAQLNEAWKMLEDRERRRAKKSNAK